MTKKYLLRETIALFATTLVMSACSAQVAAASECGLLFESKSELNAGELFDAFVICAENGEQKNANLMIAIGQIRAITDMTLFTPISEDEGQKVGELYSKLYYSFGGLGFDDVYRDPASVDQIAAAIEAAELEFEPGYDPGWVYKQTSKTDIYDEIISNSKRQRIWQMRNYAALVQDDEYFTAHQAFAKLQSENRVFEQGTPAYEESRRLSQIMRDASATIEQLPPPEDTTPYERLNEPDADAGFTQLASGFNGPTSASVNVYWNRNQARDSWLSEAFTSDELDKLLADVDFETEALFSYAFGKRMNASGKILISALGYSELYNGYNISTKIGVVPASCGVDFIESFPFVLATTDAVEGGIVNSRSSSNFPDECGAIQSAAPVE